MTKTLEHQELYDKLMVSAKRIGELAEKEALQADLNGTVSQNVIDLILEEGINRLLLPKEYNYPQIDFTTFSDLVKTVGYHNLSAAWLTYFAALHNSWVPFLPKHSMDKIFNQGGLIADIFAPVGRVEKCDGGFRVSGTWNFVSGINYADWVLAGAIYKYEDEEMPEHIGLCMKKSEVKVITDWDTLGLRGSGSNTIVCEDLFVPEDMVVRLTKAGINRKPEKLEIDEDYLYFNVPYFSAFFLGFASMSIGAAQRVLDEFKERTINRVRAGVSESTKAKSQRVLAEMALKQKSSEALLKEYIEMINNDFGQYDPSEYNVMRTKIIRNSNEIASEAILALGASALKKGNPMEMIARDLMAVGTHITSLHEDGIEAYGKFLFDYQSNSVG